MSDLLKPIPAFLLPETCWYSSKTNAPRPMNNHTAIGLHKISGINLFKNDPFNIDKIISKIMVPLRVSYNIVITREAAARVWVPVNFQAFHAGYSRYKRQDYCNRFMIGIAIVSTGKQHEGEPAFTDPQIRKLADVTAELVQTFDIDKQDIVSHEIIRNNWNKKHPTLKTESRSGDPGEHFPWEKYYTYLEDLL